MATKLNRKQALELVQAAKADALSTFKRLESLEKAFLSLRGPGRPKSNGNGHSKAPDASGKGSVATPTKDQMLKIEQLLKVAVEMAKKDARANRNVSFLQGYLKKNNLTMEGAQSVIENTTEQLKKLRDDDTVPAEEPVLMGDGVFSKYSDPDDDVLF